MNKNEYLKIEGLNYEQYCDYLQTKYGLAKKAYFRPTWTKDASIKRTKEGLVIHHRREDIAIMLSNENYAVNNPYEYQLPKNLIYCDYLEHLLLHILIFEDYITNPNKKRNEDELPGLGGIINYIVPEMNDWYSGNVSNKEWKQALQNKILKDKDVYIILLKRFIKTIKPIGMKVEKLLTSFGFLYGTWNIENNKKIFIEIEEIYKKS